MMKNLFLLFVSTLFASGSLIAQCPDLPAACTYTVTGNSAQNFNLTSGMKLCINSGTYTGMVRTATGSEIYVKEGSVFKPFLIENFAGKVVNCGTSVIENSATTNQDTIEIRNYNIFKINGPYFTTPTKWYNEKNATLEFINASTMKNASLMNKGEITGTPLFTIRDSKSINENEGIITAASIDIDAPFINNGLIRSSNLIYLGGAKIVNNCNISVNGTLNYRGSDTLFNNGLIVSEGPITLQGYHFRGSPGSFVNGLEFRCYDTQVSGAGNYYIKGYTSNYGVQGMFGSDGQGINFYDATPSGTESQIFDNQDVDPDVSVTRKPVTPWDSTWLPAGCSSKFKTVFCSGRPSENLTLSGDTSCSGSGSAAISVSGTVPGHIYQAFKENKALGSAITATGTSVVIPVPVNELQAGKNKLSVRINSSVCSFDSPRDTTHILVNNAPKTNLYVSGDTICTGDENAYIKISEPGEGVQYQAYYEALLVGNSTPPTNKYSITIPVSIRMLNSNSASISIRATIPGCTTVTLSNTAQVFVYPIPATSLITEGDTVCSTDVSASIRIRNSYRDASYYVVKNNVYLTGKRSSGGNLFLEVPVSSLNSGNNVLTVSANIIECRRLQLSQQINILVNEAHSILQFKAFGPEVPATGDSTYIKIAPFTPGLPYELFLNEEKYQTHQIADRDTLFVFFPLHPNPKENFIVTAKATIAGCAMQSYSDTALVRLHHVVTGLAGGTEKRGFNISPNPTTGPVTVFSASPFFRLEISDLSGKTIAEFNFEPTTSYSLHTPIAPGTYRLRIAGTEFSLINKLLIE